MSRFVPLRKFIFDRLYHPKTGYFCKKDYQIGELSSPIDFSSLIGFDDYQSELYKRYPKNAWLTPSEIFKPYYGMSIANYIKQATQKHSIKYQTKNKIKIIQAGAGTGSAAQSILYYFQNFSQQQLQTLQYTIVQISPTLCEHMHKKLSKSYPRLLQNKQIKIINQDITMYSPANSQNNKNQLYFMLFLEVLDNLPHDKVILNPDIDDKNNKNKYNKYSTVNIDTKQQKYQNIENDQLIKQCLQMYLHTNKNKETNKQDQINNGLINWLTNKIFQKYYLSEISQKQLFLPTYLLQLFKKIKNNVPNAHFIISDFDHLISNVPGINAPIVSTKGQKSADKKDYNTYLIDRGQADIFFPTNFNLVKYMHENILKKDAQIVKSDQFFQQFSHQKWSTSRSGFNPIKEDFNNTSFLVTKI